MKARTPLDELQFLGEEVAMPQPQYPVGTKIDPRRLDAESLAYYWRTIVRETLRDTQKIVYELQKQGFMAGMAGKKMLPYNKDQIRAKLDMVRHADSVELAGFHPGGMHVTGTIGNQCYLVQGQCHSGVNFDCYLLFRRTVDGNKLAYIHAHPVIGEAYLKALLVAEKPVLLPIA